VFHAGVGNCFDQLDMKWHHDFCVKVVGPHGTNKLHFSVGSDVTNWENTDSAA
jgi:hypothetical protein